MPFWMVREDITHMGVDAVVNAANTALKMGGGVCGAIFQAAGEAQMQAACDALAPIAPGDAVITPGFNLKAKYVMHTAGLMWQGGHRGEEEILRACYRSSLRLAQKMRLKSVAFPLLSSGIYGYPPRDALRVATEEIRSFLDDNDMDVWLALFGAQAVQAAITLEGDIRQYVDDNYVEAAQEADTRRGRRNATYHAPQPPSPGPGAFPPEEEAGQFLLRESIQSERTEWIDYYIQKTISLDTAEESSAVREKPKGQRKKPESDALYAPKEAKKPAPPTLSLEERIRAPKSGAARPADGLPLDRPFSALLLELIDRKGLTDPQVYRRANIDRRLFSKLRRKGYMPSKRTALALCVALELTEQEAESLLFAAGFALSRSILSDVIVRYFLERGVFDVFRINAALFAYDQQPLGGTA